MIMRLVYYFPPKVIIDHNLILPIVHLDISAVPLLSPGQLYLTRFPFITFSVLRFFVNVSSAVDLVTLAR